MKTPRPRAPRGARSDSDAHAPDEWVFAETAVAHARLAGIPGERVINCWPLDFLLEWAAGLSRRDR